MSVDSIVNQIEQHKLKIKNIQNRIEELKRQSAYEENTLKHVRSELSALELALQVMKWQPTKED
jgi:chromosome segregation ATPase